MIGATQPVVQPQDSSVTTQHNHTEDIDAANGLAVAGTNSLPNATPVSLENTQDTTNRELRLADTGASAQVRGATDPVLLAQGTPRVQPGPGIATTQSPVNFNAIPADRKAALTARAEQLINQYASSRADPRVSPNGTPLREINHRVLDYNSFKNILTDLKNDRSYSDNEKAYIWSKIASQKGSGSLVGGFSGGSYRPSISGSNPNIRDSDFFGARQLDTPGHTILSFEDSKHGFGVSSNGKPGMGYQTSEAARNRIINTETPRGLFSPLGFNQGDANASMAMVSAFHAYRDAPTGHKFEAFANTWINGIVAR